MATSDWSSTYTDGAVSANRSLSPIAVSTSSPQDSGNSSPHSPDFARDVSLLKIIFYRKIFLSIQALQLVIINDFEC